MLLDHTGCSSALTSCPCLHLDPSGGRAGWAAGDDVQAQDGAGRWYDAKVIDVQGTGDAQEFAVHYLGCKSSADEWVSRERLRARVCAAQPDERRAQHLHRNVRRSPLIPTPHTPRPLPSSRPMAGT